jgi:hypothetical protein
MGQFNVSGPYEDYKVSVTCNFTYDDYIVSVKHMSDKRCSPTAAHSSSSTRAFKSPTQIHLNHFVWERNECLWCEKHVHVDCDELVSRVRNYVPSITEQNLGLKGTCRRRTEDALVSDVSSRNRHLTSLCPTALSFFPFSSFFISSLVFADRQCLCLKLENYFQNSSIRSAGYNTKLSSVILSTRSINPHTCVAIFWTTNPFCFVYTLHFSFAFFPVTSCPRPRTKYYHLCRQYYTSYSICTKSHSNK